MTRMERVVLLLSAALLPLSLLATAPAAAFTRDDMNGTWLAAEIDDENVAARLVITPERIEVTPLKKAPEETDIAEYVPGESTGDLHVLRATDDGREMKIQWLFQTRDRALLWTARSDDLIVAVRVGVIPAEVQGVWKVWIPKSRGRITGLTLGADSYSMVEGGETKTGRVYAVGGGHTPVGLVVERRPGDFEWFEVQPLPGGNYLIWEHGDDDYVLIYREGARPAWAVDPPPGQDGAKPPPPVE